MKKIFKRDDKSGAGFAVMQESEKESPKYPKPKILLIDIKDDSEMVLKKAGYNISSGTFGTPFEVVKSDQFISLVPNHELPNCSEKDIVVIDLLPSKSLESPIGEKITSKGEDDWWVKCNLGYVDPRPRVMLSLRKEFDRILDHGGVFIVFADAKQSQQLILGHIGDYNALVTTKHLDFNNWSFLTLLDNVYIDFIEESGEEIEIVKFENDFDKVFAKGFNEARYLCTMKCHLNPIDWLPFAFNKYKEPVAGIFPPNNNRKGFILVLPQIKNKSEVIQNIVSIILPQWRPELFPFIEGGRWVERNEYEIPEIVELKHSIEKTKLETKNRIESILIEIETERERYSFLHDLLRETDRKLVDAVQKTMNLFGFKKIIDVDKQKSSAGDSFRDEDLQIDDEPIMLLVEIKGVGGIPTDDDSLQVAKHIAPRMKELKRHSIQGLSIINHQRHIPGIDRENVNPFRDTIIKAAEKQDVGLMTTWELFRLARGFLRNRWKYEHVKGLFYKTGRVNPIPTHYKYLGKVNAFWEKAGALSIILESGKLYIGNRIAFALPVDFIEQTVDSIKIDDQLIEEADTGKEIGIKTILTKAQAKKGINVYLVQ